MNKVLKFITNPFKMLLVCGICFGIAYIDSIMHNASSLSDLSFVGKLFTDIFMVAFTILVIRYGILPIVKWLSSLVR